MSADSRSTSKRQLTEVEASVDRTGLGARASASAQCLLICLRSATDEVIASACNASRRLDTDPRSKISELKLPSLRRMATRGRAADLEVVVVDEDLYYEPDQHDEASPDDPTRGMSHLLYPAKAVNRHQG